MKRLRNLQLKSLFYPLVTHPAIRKAHNTSGNSSSGCSSTSWTSTWVSSQKGGNRGANGGRRGRYRTSRDRNRSHNTSKNPHSLTPAFISCYDQISWLYYYITSVPVWRVDGLTQTFNRGRLKYLRTNPGWPLFPKTQRNQWKRWLLSLQKTSRKKWWRIVAQNLRHEQTVLNKMTQTSSLIQIQHTCVLSLRSRTNNIQ